jgi:hypothetical protein
MHKLELYCQPTILGVKMKQILILSILILIAALNSRTIYGEAHYSYGDDETLVEAKQKCLTFDTAQRDINDLIEKKILEKNPGGSRSSSYKLYD